MQVKSDEGLFRKWRSLGERVSGLGSIVQNDAETSEAQAKEWTDAAISAGADLCLLIAATLKHLDCGL